MSGRSDANSGPTMALIARGDLKLSTGKWMAQAGHAAVSATMMAKKSQPRLVERWQASGARKIALKVDDEAEMLRLAGEAKKAGIVAYVVRDAGHTEVEANTATVLAIGPAPRRSIDGLCGGLGLFN